MMLRIGSRGFTLVEIMLTVTILAIGLAGILQAYMVSVNALKAGDETVNAVCLAKEKMAQIELDIRKGRGILAGGSKGTFDGENKDFLWELNAAPCAIKNLDEVALAVYSKAGGRKTSLTTYEYAENKEQSE